MRKVALLAVMISALMTVTSCNLNPEPTEIINPVTTQDNLPMVLCNDSLKIQEAQPFPSVPGNKPKKPGSGSSC